jgi:hypothetical protein
MVTKKCVVASRHSTSQYRVEALIARDEDRDETEDRIIRSGQAPAFEWDPNFE